MSDVIGRLLENSATQDAHTFLQIIGPIQKDMNKDLEQSFYITSKEKNRYQNMLDLIIDGDFPPDVRATASLLKIDFEAKLAASQGDFEGALEVYEKSGIEPTGLMADLKQAQEEGHLSLLTAFYTYCQSKGCDSSYSPTRKMNGVEFLISALGSGAVFLTTPDPNNPANSFLEAHGQKLTEAQRALFWNVNDDLSVSIKGQPSLQMTIEDDISIESTMAATVAPESVITLEVSSPLVKFQLNGAELSPASTDIKYDLTSQKWLVSIPGSVIYANISSHDHGQVDLWVVGHKGAFKEFISLELTQAAQLPLRESASLDDFQDSVMASLASQKAIIYTSVIAPNKDDTIASRISFQTIKLSPTKLAERFLKFPEYVLDPESARGRVFIGQIRACQGDADKIKKALNESDLNPQERMRFFRLADMFIGGGVGPYQHLRGQGYDMSSLRIEYTQGGDPCLLKITAQKTIPITSLRGEMGVRFKKLPLARQEYYRQKGGIPIVHTIEIYSETPDADIAVGRHLAARDTHILNNVTHAWRPGESARDHISDGNIPVEANNRVVAYNAVHCYGVDFQEGITAQFNGVYLGPTTGSTKKGVASWKIASVISDAMVTGQNELTAAKLSYTEAANGNKSNAYTQKKASAVARFGEKKSIMALLTANSRVVYHPTEQKYYIYKPGLTKPIVAPKLLEPLISQFENVEVELPELPNVFTLLFEALMGPGAGGTSSKVVAMAGTETPGANISL